MYGILHYLISITKSQKNQSIKPNFILGTRSTLRRSFLQTTSRRLLLWFCCHPVTKSGRSEIPVNVIYFTEPFLEWVCYNENEKLFKVWKRYFLVQKKLANFSYVQFVKFRKSLVLRNEKYNDIIVHFLKKWVSWYLLRISFKTLLLLWSVVGRRTIQFCVFKRVLMLLT